MGMAGLLAPTVPAQPNRLPPNYAHDLSTFRQHREQAIGGEDGWITLIGLYWLKEGENRAGSDPDSEVPLPRTFLKREGTFVLRQAAVQFVPAPGSSLLLNGKPVSAATIREDKDILSQGSVKFFVIRRGDKWAVRVRDNGSGERRNFTHLDWFPIDASWRIMAAFTAWDQPRTLTFDTMVPGIREDMESPGYVTFTRGGRTYRLDPVVEDDQLFFVFRDQTAGKTTYSAARFLYTDMPKDGTVILDFNRAINPPCVFTTWATCPLPPPQNRLAIEVSAGEKMFGSPAH